MNPDFVLVATGAPLNGCYSANLALLFEQKSATMFVHVSRAEISQTLMQLLFEKVNNFTQQIAVSKQRKKSACLAKVNNASSSL